MKHMRTAILATAAAAVVAGAAATAVALWPRKEHAPVVRVFHAAGLSPFIRQISDECERELRSEEPFVHLPEV